MTLDKSENLSSTRGKVKKQKKVLQEERAFEKLPMAIEKFQLPNDQISYKKIYEGEQYTFDRQNVGKVKFIEVSLVVPMPLLDLYNAFVSFFHPGFEDALDYFQEMLLQGIYKDFQKHFTEFPKEIALEHIQMLREYFLVQETND